MACFSFAYLSAQRRDGAFAVVRAVQVHECSWRPCAPASTSRPCPGRPGPGRAGLVCTWVAPGLSAPDPRAPSDGARRAAWGLYSLVGRATRDPLEATANNFILAVRWCWRSACCFLGDLQISLAGCWPPRCRVQCLGAGLRGLVRGAAGLTATRAATVQLSVPPSPPRAVWLLLAEPLTLRLLLASAGHAGRNRYRAGAEDPAPQGSEPELRTGGCAWGPPVRVAAGGCSESSRSAGCAGSAAIRYLPACPGLRWG